jgi:dienelactone hydrolase
MAASLRQLNALVADSPIAVSAPVGPVLRDLALPPRFQIEPPATGITEGAAKFLGAWGGLWDDVLPHLLVVERIEPGGRLRAIYAVGDAPQWLIARQWIGMTGVATADRLVLDNLNATISYEIDPRGRLVGTYRMRSGLLSVGVFERMDVDVLADPSHPLPCPILGESVRIPHSTVQTPDGSRPIELAATLYRPKGTKPAPLAIINHGSASGIFSPRQTFRSATQALWLLERGFTVLVPMRRGRGESEGVFGEETFPLDFEGGLEQAIEDLDSALIYAQALPFVQRGPALLVGQSRGGFLSSVYASLYPEAVAGVINFAGGWTAEDDQGAFNRDALAEAGRTARVPQLWLYGKQDSYYGEKHIRANHSAFVKGGGRATLELFDVPGDGHFLIGYPDLWRWLADAYLDGLRL